jgi:hypothetical protein
MGVIDQSFVRVLRCQRIETVCGCADRGRLLK